MDPVWSTEEYYRGEPSDSWRSNDPSKPGGGLLDFMYNRNPRIISKKEAHEMIAKIAAERALASHAKDVASGQEPISLISSPSNSLGEAYYDLEAGSSRQEGGAVQ